MVNRYWGKLKTLASSFACTNNKQWVDAVLLAFLKCYGREYAINATSEANPHDAHGN